MSIKIVVDSASDITFDESKELGLSFMPLTIFFGENEYKDNIDITNSQFYDFLEESEMLPKTSQVTPYAYEQEFQKIVDNGDIAIAITLSSDLSGTYSSAKIAAERFPGKVFVVDSKSGCIGEKILVLYALELVKANLDPEEIVKKLEEKKEKISIYFLLNTLENLYKGGRLSKMSAIAGTILSVKPIITIDNGFVVLAGKARGFKKGITMLNKMAESFEFDEGMPYMLGYSGNDTALLNQYISKDNTVFGKKLDEFPVSMMGSTIGTHIGPGSIGIAFFKK
ncbi:DegV family protein [Peptostreptococcus faecalis]|uniref:DegV family protein n=1 Tax=Peptostreptococcus faecalis TaxID=2045015 RepID=UPI000C7E6C14|nr:DegV family protein [Peptostreptococcus faecalis]